MRPLENEPVFLWPLKFNIESRRLHSRLKNSVGILFTGLFLIIVISVTWIALQKLEFQTKKDIKASIQTVLLTTQESMYIWTNHRKQNVQNIASSNKLVELTQQLLNQYYNGRERAFNQTLKETQELLGLMQKENSDYGFFIISPQMINIASSKDSDIGKSNIIFEKRKEYITRVFNVNGEVVFVPTVHSNDWSKLSTENVTTKLPEVFVASPIKDESNRIIAALAFRIDPTNHFNRIAKLGRIGETGETYAFDKNGLLITESRFDHHLRRLGLINPNDNGILSIRISDPGGNLLDNYVPTTAKHKWPLTVMARTAISAVTGFNVEGYRDYRGVDVFGTWLWDDELGFGLATEIDKSEAMRSFHETRAIIIVVLTTTVILAFILNLILVRLRIRSQRQLKRAHDKLEIRVHERTKELSEARDKLETANTKLEILATTDPLTGLANRRSLDKHLDEEWRRCSRDKRPLSVLMIDIDCFKDYNDQYGHQAGDNCLKQVAVLIKRTNVASRPGDMIARYGGEEFCIVLSGVSCKEASKIAERVGLKILNEKIEHKATRVEHLDVVSISLGVATEPDFKNSTSIKLLNRADQALYRAKSRGRNQVITFNKRM